MKRGQASCRSVLHRSAPNVCTHPSQRAPRLPPAGNARQCKRQLLFACCPTGGPNPGSAGRSVMAGLAQTGVGQDAFLAAAQVFEVSMLQHLSAVDLFRLSRVSREVQRWLLSTPPCLWQVGPSSLPALPLSEQCRLAHA